jgi:hypothetical protein
MNKKEIRDAFRKAVFDRDGYRCAMCGYKPENVDELDAHHVTDRNDMPFGGYVAANGITLCTDRCGCNLPGLDCHQKAETLHATGQLVPGYTPNDLYDKIKSSYGRAYQQSLLLGGIPKTQVIDIMARIQAVSVEELEVCLQLTELISEATWGLTCDELREFDPFVRAYGKGRYVVDF